MNEINTAFLRSEQILPFLHVLGVILLISLQIVAITLIKTLDDMKILNKFLKFFMFSFFAILGVILVSNTVFYDSSDLKFADPMFEGIVLTQFAVFIFLIINHIYISYKILQLSRTQNSDDIAEHLIIIGNYFIPLNICVSLFAVFLGVVMKVFE